MAGQKDSKNVFRPDFSICFCPFAKPECFRAPWGTLFDPSAQSQWHLMIPLWTSERYPALFPGAKKPGRLEVCSFKKQAVSMYQLQRCQEPVDVQQSSCLLFCVDFRRCIIDIRRKSQQSLDTLEEHRIQLKHRLIRRHRWNMFELVLEYVRIMSGLKDAHHFI